MSPTEALMGALAAARAALDSGDPQAAADALSRAVAAREALESSGTRLAPPEAERAQALFAACQASAERAHAELARALGLAGRSSRARAAYRR